MGTFIRTQMLYNDEEYYNWTAEEAGDDPNYLKGTEYSELNRTEGYEALYFINSTGDEFWPNKAISTATYQKIERMIRHDVPENIKDHDEIRKWLRANWKNH